MKRKMKKKTSLKKFMMIREVNLNLLDQVNDKLLHMII